MRPHMRGDGRCMKPETPRRTAVKRTADCLFTGRRSVRMGQIELPPQSTRSNDQEDAAGRCGKLGLRCEFFSKRCRYVAHYRWVCCDDITGDPAEQRRPGPDQNRK